jgi:hypothetical protein
VFGVIDLELNSFRSTSNSTIVQKVDSIC